MDVFNQIGKILQQVLNWVVSLLPNSPFQAIDNSPIKEYLPYINYFVPFDFIVTTFTAWLAAIAIYYIYSVILRWVKAIN